MKWTRLLIVLMGWAHLAQAAPDALSPDARASAAREMRGEGRYPEAVATIEAGLAEAPAHTELRLLHALTLIDMRRYEAALVACRAYLKVARPGPNRRQMGQQCRDLSQVEGTVLTVEVAPGPADVYLGYEALGIACVAAPRCDKGLLPGRYTIIVKRPGYAPWRERIRMRRGQRRALAVELEELPSELTITVRPLVPAGAAEVVVDGRVLGPEQDSLEVAAGEHELRVAAPGYFVHTQIISAHEGRPLAVEVALDERVLVEASPPHAVFELDGQPVELEPVAAAEPGEATPAAATTDAGSGPALGVDEPGASNSTVAAEDAEPSPPRPAASVRSLRLPGDRRAHTLTARAPGYLDRTVGLALDRPVEYSLTLALEPVPAPPPPDAAPERCRWCKQVAATAAATAT
ncbi:PEGA domain-containing protein, partial [Haliangium sp.]